MALNSQHKLLGRVDGNTNYATYEFVITSGVTVTDGDFVYTDGSGRITNSSVATQRLVGMALQTATGTSGSVKCLVCIDPLMRYLLQNDNDSSTFAAANVLDNFDLIGATGAQLVDTSSQGTSGQLLCLEYNPQIDPVGTDTTYGVFTVAEHILNTGSGAQ